MTFTLAKVIINNLIEPPRSKDVDTERNTSILQIFQRNTFILWYPPRKKNPREGSGVGPRLG